MGRAAVAFLVAGVSLAACKSQPMASSAQCEKLLDRYIDLKLSENPAAPAMTDIDRAHLRGKIANDVLADSDVQQVKNQCQTEVTEAEFQCAIKAATSRAWNDCIQ
jgi:hypothetical protein